MLHLYRRHRVSCRHRSQSYRRCSCPLYVKGTLGGTYIRMSLDQTNWDAATRLIGQWTEAGAVGQILETAHTVTDAARDFLADAKTRGLAEATIRKYTLLLEKKLVPWCSREGYVLLQSLDVDALSRFRATWQEGALAKQKTQERLKAFLGWCLTRKWIDTNHAKQLSSIRVPAVPTLPFSADEMTRIIAACDRYPTHNSFRYDNRARMRAFVLLLRWSGLRMRDAVTLDWQRIKDAKLFLYTQKTGTAVWVPLPKVCTAALDALPQRAGYVFWSGDGKAESATSVWRRSLRTLFTLAKVKHGHAHRFRDTFAVELLLQGANLGDVSILLGHSSIKVTERHYAPWVQARQSRLESVVQRTWQDGSSLAGSPDGTPAQRPTPESATTSRTSRRRVPA